VERRGILADLASVPGLAEATAATRGEGRLAPRPIDPASVDRSSGEPL
jgi:hypothetical protein